MGCKNGKIKRTDKWALIVESSLCQLNKGLNMFKNHTVMKFVGQTLFYFFIFLLLLYFFAYLGQGQGSFIYNEF